jgi:hypothetical protein
MPSIDIGVNDARVQYTASAGQTVFNYDFVLFNETDVVVIKAGTTLTPTTDYTVTGVGTEAGGTIVLTSGAALNDLVTISRNTAPQRQSQYQSDGIFDAAPIERDLDTIITILQEHDRDLARSVSLSIDSSISNISLPTPSANLVIGWNPSANGLVNGPSFADLGTATSAATTAAATATTQAGIATTAAGTATTEASTATTQAGISTAQAVIATAATAYQYVYSTTTTASDPGSGNLRFNNATLSSATALYISETTELSQAISAVLASWDDSTTTVKGQLKMVKRSTPATFALFNITGTITDNGTWDTFTVAYVAGSGTFSNSDSVSLAFTRTGDTGSSGGENNINFTTITTNNNPTNTDEFMWGASGSLVKTSFDNMLKTINTLTIENTIDLASDKSVFYDASAGSPRATSPENYRQKVTAPIFQNSQSAAYTLVLADTGKHIFHPSADTTARTWTIPANASVAFPIGTAVTFVNQNAAGVITIAITSDTMRLAGAGTTGSRTLAANGVATAIKITSTEWIISGTGLT